MNNQDHKHPDAQPFMHRNPRKRGKRRHKIGGESDDVNDNGLAHADHLTFRMTSTRAITKTTGMTIQMLRLASLAW